MNRNIKLLVLLICVLNSALTIYIGYSLWTLMYYPVASNILPLVLKLLFVMEFLFLVLPWYFFIKGKYQISNRIALASFAIVLAASLITRFL